MYDGAMRFSIHISFYCIDSRFCYVNRIIDETNQYKWESDVFIHTNNPYLSAENFNQCTNGSLHVIFHDLSNEHPFFLTWKCRDLLKQQKDDYDVFMYIEDDMLVPSRAIQYWLDNNERLVANNYNLGFVRIETDVNGTEYITDLWEKLDTSIDLGGEIYCLNNKNPYCAFWIYTKAEFARFVESHYYDVQNIPEYYVREKSAVGLHGNQNYWYKGTVIPFAKDGDSVRLVDDCRIYHMPNNYLGDNSLFATIQFQHAVENQLKHSVDNTFIRENMSDSEELHLDTAEEVSSTRIIIEISENTDVPETTESTETAESVEVPETAETTEPAESNESTEPAESNETTESAESTETPLIIKISNEILDNFELKGHKYLVDQEYYDLRSGVNEYRLYSYLTTFFNNKTILDIGTFTGRSSIALSYNESNRVISYDIEDHIKRPNHPIYTKPNVEFRIRDVLLDLTEELVSTVKIVMIDIDHYGVNEKRIIDRLKTLGFKGLILLDDITKHPDPTINRCMNQLWDSIEDACYDMTDYGHWSGTGVVVIGDNIRFCR